MKAPRAPKLDPRRTADFAAELRARALAWIPSWGLADGERDFGRALLDIAARFNSEVAERLDNAGEKMRRGFLDWLAVRGEAARPARMPVVFKLADAAQEAVLASAPVRMQADAAGTPVVFETEKDVRVVPGRLDVVVGIDANDDAFYLPPPGLSDLKPQEPVPKQWLLKSFASTGGKKLQLDPDSGLEPEMILEAAGRQYRIVKVDNDIVTIEPGLTNELPQSTIVRKVVAFSPFDGVSINRQEHALYLGHMELLNIEAAATIEVVGATTLRTGVTWQYWGKVDGNDETDWQPLTLASNQQPDAVVLEKKKGAVEPRDIEGKNSRWIRAFLKTVENTANPLLQTDTLELRANCQSTPPACPTVGDEPPSPEAEAMANTTPLVLDNTFFPLGKEPRQFDAFYLGSKEAFSKKDAAVQLRFELADPSFQALSAVRRGNFINQVTAGVGRDSALHLFASDPTTGSLRPLHDRDPLRPPLPGFFGTMPPGDGVVLDSEPSWRLPVFTEPGYAGFLVGATAGDSIWVWVEHPSKNLSGWFPFGELPPDTAGSSPPIDGLVFLRASARMVALRDGKLFARDWPSGPPWTEVTVTASGNPVTLEVIAPIFAPAVDGLTTEADFMAISDAGEVFRVTLTTPPTTATCAPLLAGRTVTTAAPVGFVHPVTGLTVVAVESVSPRKLLAENTAATREFELGTDIEVIGSLDFGFDGAEMMAVAGLRDDATQAKTLATWTPFGAVQPPPAFEITIPPEAGTPLGPATMIGNFVMVPTFSAAVLVARVDLALRTTVAGTLRTALVVPSSSGIGTSDFVAIPIAPTAPMHQLEPVPAGVTNVDRTLFEFNFKSIDGEVFLFRAAQEFTGDVDDTNLSEVKLNHTLTGQEGVLLIETDLPPALYSVTGVNATTKIATLSSPLQFAVNPAAPVTVKYRVRERMSDVHWPLLRLSGANANWDPQLLDRTKLFFPGATPKLQRAEAFQIDAAGHPDLVVLRRHFTVGPPVTVAGVEFVVNGAIGPFVINAGDTSTNPELSWEYSNGKGWGGLNVTADTTRHLKTTGVVRFKVPFDIAESDWAGKTNFWIRARLIGGDYGKEKVTVTSTTSGNTTTQNVDRSTAGIRAPSVMNLHISYQVCTEVPPAFVLAQDSGSFRDQTDANKTPGALVEAFVPLALILGRLSKTGSQTSSSTDCPPDCRCHAAQGTTSGMPVDAGSAPAAPTRPVAGRALFLGLDATLSGASVTVLLLVEREHDHSNVAPIKIEALVADRFVPIVADDGTRAVGESGLLSMAFAIPPTRGELFGKTLTWLCLSPKTGTGTAEWKPTLRGAYLNAVWASATETLTRELVGSSDGSPNLTLRLARPPVLHGTLELRVKEPLGDEERATLYKDDAQRVLSQVQDLSGDWVLWKQVTDPGDEPATERVYAFDEGTGEIRFGDGQHGMIPPIGRDVIVAFRYQRTEPPKPGSETVPGNLIAPRTALNLVSPVESVEEVFAADQAAGGAPPELDDRVLRFGFSRFRHRHRAVTPQDLEDLALQSSPDIVQARGFLRRGFVRLVIVMRGKNPIPNAAQIRELHRLLTAAAPPALSEQGALRIVGPSLRRLRVGLTLQVESFDHAGALSEEVKKRLIALFDASTGGSDGDGWALGVNPNEEDVALTLVDANHLDSLATVTFHEVAGDDVERAWPAMLKPVELAFLDEDPVRIEFVTTEVMA